METEGETLFQELLNRVTAVEAACMAVAAQRNSRILTNDQDARKLAAQLKIPVNGTSDILLCLVEANALTLSEANAILGWMVSIGYRSPVQKLEEL